MPKSVQPSAIPDERVGYAPSLDLAERRQAMEAAIAAGAWRTEPPPRTALLGGVRVLGFEPPCKKRGVVLHFHGGGFRIGRPEMCGLFAAALAARCDVEVICPDYRLAPEHPFPAALNDACAVLKALDGGGKPLILSGDSAGGGLAASLAALSTKEGALAGVVLLSPWLDLTVKSRAYDDNAATDPMFSRASAEEAADLYLQGVSPQHPFASPVFASVAHFPPTLIVTGAEEVLIEDSQGLHEKLVAAGRETRLQMIVGMEHSAVARNMTLRGARTAFETVVDFLERRLQLVL